MRMQLERTNVSFPGGARLMILRDVIDHMDPAKMATQNCSHFAKYGRSVQGQSPYILSPPFWGAPVATKSLPLLHSALRACEVARSAARGEAPMAGWEALSTIEKGILNSYFNRAARMSNH